MLRFSSLQFTFQRQEGHSEGSDLRQGFCHPNCTVSTFKGTKQLSVSVCDVLVGCLNSNKRIIPVFWTIEVMHFDSRKNNMSTLNNERLAKI